MNWHGWDWLLMSLGICGIICALSALFYVLGI